MIEQPARNPRICPPLRSAVLVLLAAAACLAPPVAAYPIVTNCTWSEDIKESGSFFVCPANQVLTGRRHFGDENGDTRYLCCDVLNPTLAAVTNHVWSANIKESNGTFFNCSANQMLVGRLHLGDENGNTRYLCANVVSNGVIVPPYGGFCSWSADIKESNGTFFACPIDHVLVGRRHSGDENGNTRYLCCYLSVVAGNAGTPPRPPGAYAPAAAGSLPSTESSPSATRRWTRCVWPPRLG